MRDDAGVVSKGLTVRDPGCLSKKMAPLGDNVTSYPFEDGYKITGHSNSSTRYILKRIKNICPHKYWYIIVHVSTIHSRQKVEIIYKPINRRTDD